METSIIIAKILGPFYLIVAAGLLLNQDVVRSLARDAATRVDFLYFTGLISLLLGLLIVVIHNVWSGWPVVITILGWIAVVRGVVRVVAPHRAQQFISRFAGSKNALTAAALVALALGAYLTGMGYWLGPLG